MKNIGLKLKEKRIQNGLSIDEVAEDLKLRPSQIESIEEGRKDDFKDIFYLKYFIRDYAKYLGLDSDKMLDEFNEYLFDETSKIPVDMIKEAKKEKSEVKIHFFKYIFHFVFLYWWFFYLCYIFLQEQPFFLLNYLLHQ